MQRDTRSFLVSVLSLAILLLGTLTQRPAFADPIPVVASLKIEILASTPLDPVTVTSTGVADLSAGPVLQLPAGLITAKTTVTVMDPGLISQVAIAGSVVGTTLVMPGPSPATNGTGTFSSGAGIGGGFGGLMPLNGFAFARAVGAWIPLPISVVGNGGTAMGGVPGLSVTLTGSGWTTGTVTLPGAGGSGTVTRAGANVPGMIQLVTPIRINVAVLGFIPAFGTLTLTPEPSALAMLGSGALGLLLLGRRARRRRAQSSNEPD